MQLLNLVMTKQVWNHHIYVQKSSNHSRLYCDELAYIFDQVREARHRHRHTAHVAHVLHVHVTRPDAALGQCRVVGDEWPLGNRCLDVCKVTS